MAGPAFRTIGARATSAGATSIAPAKPTVDGANGILIAVVSSKNNATHSTATAGWARIGAQQNSGASFTASVWIAAESAAAPTFTWTGSVACSAEIAYYSDPQNTVDTTVGASSVSSGLTSTHTSTAITSTRDDALAVYVDTAAANTAIATPAGWTEESDTGSATDAGRTAFGDKAIATSGSSSGAISVTGANAAWVQWQIEVRGSAPTSGAQSSKLESGAWLDAADGADSTKLESGAWLDPADGADSSKLEVGAWLEAQSTTLDSSKLESGAWLDAADGADSSKLEVGAWLETATTVVDNPGFTSIIW